MKISRFITGTILCLGASLSALYGQSKLTIDADEQLGKVNRLCFGHNMEAADGRGIFSEAFDSKSYDKSGIKYGQGFWNPETKSIFPEVAAEFKKLSPGMMRYPGGCLAHNFDWKKTIGPQEKRPDWNFGIDEYISFCRTMNIEPIITLSDYVVPTVELPSHCAELVEYLNAPADESHPWAQKRKEYGHAEPYNVKFFELGNETDHGNHKCLPKRKFTADEYIKCANATAKAMKTIDPSIKTGAVSVPGYGDDYDCEWNKTVFKNASRDIDFIVVHFYGPGVDLLGTETHVFKSAMAYPEQLNWRLAKYHECIKECSGREMPLAVTEFNIGSTQNEPHYYRFSYTAGLMCADMMRLWLDPSNKIQTANYWQILNGYWGAYNSNVSTGKITKRRASLPFLELWGLHFGSRLIKSEIENSPASEAAPAPGLLYAIGNKIQKSEKLADIQYKAISLNSANQKDISTSSSAPDKLSVDFKKRQGNFFADISSFSRNPELIQSSKACRFKLSFEAKFTAKDGFDGKVDMGLGLCDMRGWDKVKSAIAVTGTDKAKDWKEFSGNFTTLPDFEAATILLRMENQSTKPVSGTLEIRNLKVELFSLDSFPAYQELTAISSLSEDGETLNSMIFNKSMDKTIDLEIQLKGFKGASGKAFELYQPKITELDYFSPTVRELTISGSKIFMQVPPHSMTSLEIRKKKSSISSWLGLD